MESVTAGGKIVFKFVACYIRLAVYCDKFGMPVCKQVSVCPHKYLRNEEPHVYKIHEILFAHYL